MRPYSTVLLVGSLTTGLLLGCGGEKAVAPSLERGAPLFAKGGPNASQFATLITLDRFSAANAVNQAGTIIAGFRWRGRIGTNDPMVWTLQYGAWTANALPFAATATSAWAKAVNDQGDVAGDDFAGSSSHVVLWPSTGGFMMLGCGELGEASAMSAAGQIVVGVDRTVLPRTAAVWQPGACREDLPRLGADGHTFANAVNGDGTIVGGAAAPSELADLVPVRWRRVSGAWQIEQLDTRSGWAFGANSAGDLVGTARLPCTSGSGQCSRGLIWYAAGGSRDIGTLGGETTTPRGINAAGEVVGLSTLSNGNTAPFLWSEALGMRQLPVQRSGSAFAVSGVRSDGTRIVVGEGGGAALAWVVRNQ
jgi:probable HAF family extracellular repeat protein